ncbi:hypothetical protein [Geodermatophilus marinus]|uniref:hypothetical protein n=1 Tax=Geodermatophilus sp. LHW52908 TaxID=2303986 RepID=UPI000E3BD599|nr:hypothetical protein [Geodermatophilus sp. LHW52908]RFU20000.1 hypothetical protein D0Z06_18810 [Geodermatophilus sp. LHW52908]
MSENDPDPHLPDEGLERSELGGRPQPDAGDPTRGGRRGAVGETAGIAADSPDDGSQYPVGGGRVTEEEDAPPVADPGPSE